MQDLTQAIDSHDTDASVDVPDDAKMHLVDRHVIFEAVAHLRSHGFGADEVQRSLVRYFYVDLDLLNEALTEH